MDGMGWMRARVCVCVKCVSLYVCICVSLYGSVYVYV
jgi:hypothetical protein